MINFTTELKNIMTEDPGVPIMSPDELRARSQTIVLLTNSAPDELLALAGPDRKATLLSIDPPMITLPYQKGVFKVRPEDIVFETHHTGRDVTEAGAEETPYEKFFASAMKKFGVSSPIELSPDDTKKFFNYVDKNWKAEEESDGSKNEILPALVGLGAAGLAGAGMAAGGIAKGIGSAVGGVARGVGSLAGDDETEDTNEIAPALAAVAGAAGAGAAGKVMDKITGDDNEDVSTGKVGKKDKGSYRRAYKLALKKYQIHSADELDTPAERKGFTAYVDKLWKAGEVKETSADTDEGIKDLSLAAKRKAQQAGKGIKSGAKKLGAGAKKAAAGAKKSVDQMATDRKDAAEKKQKERERKRAADKKERDDKQAAREKEQAAEKRDREEEAMWKERDREQAQDKPDREQDNIDRERERFEKLKKQVDDPDDDASDAKGNDNDKDKGGGKIKKGLGGFAAAIKQAADKEKAFVSGN